MKMYFIILLFFSFSFINAQLEKVALKPNPTKKVSFGNLGAGPYKKLAIRNVMVIPGHGGPASGPYDILVTGNVISKMLRHDPKDPEKMKGDRVIEGNNLYVMPGMLNLHLHLRLQFGILQLSHFLIDLLSMFLKLFL